MNRSGAFVPLSVLVASRGLKPAARGVVEPRRDPAPTEWRIDSNELGIEFTHHADQ